MWWGGVDKTSLPLLASIAPASLMSSLLHLYPSFCASVRYNPPSLYSLFSFCYPPPFHFNHHFPFQLHQLHSFQQLPASFSFFFHSRHLSVSTFLPQLILASASECPLLLPTPPFCPPSILAALQDG